MKRNSALRILGSFAFLALSSTQFAHAAPGDILPPAQTYNGVTYLNGGVGKEQSAAMRNIARQYDLRMVFSEKKDNEFIANAKVDVLDGKGVQVLHVDPAGPRLYAKLPKGKYQVKAELNGQTQQRTVVVPEQHASELRFHWTGDAKHG